MTMASLAHVRKADVPVLKRSTRTSRPPEKLIEEVKRVMYFKI